MSTSAEEDILVKNVGDKGVITLNRPKALNSVNMSMIRKILPLLQQWEKEKTMVLIKGSGEKAFCAGGDVRAIYEAGLKGEKLGSEFFRIEYTTNGLIGTYKIPYIAFIDGIVMGGGVGLSVHGQYRVATERTMFAMPETAIALFPDVGGSYFLPRLSGKLGCYLALTGDRIKGSEVLKAGIATHFVDSKTLPQLEDELMKCQNTDNINATLKKFSVDDGKQFGLAPFLDKINHCFAADTVEGIYTRLEQDNSEWAHKTIKLLNKMSPTSMKVTLKQLEKGSKMTLLECLQMEYRMAVNTVNKKEFYEGVRALLVDKDQKPLWNPAKLTDVTDSIVDSHFAKLTDIEELKHKL